LVSIAAIEHDSVKQPRMYHAEAAAAAGAQALLERLAANLVTNFRQSHFICGRNWAIGPVLGHVVAVFCVD
jgi:hypothetical protein